MKYTTYQMMTPANGITLIGLVLTLAGCFYLNSWLGLSLVVLGRLLDLVDGPVARATRKTEFSVFFDPTADKIALGAILISILLFGLVPWPVILYILLQNLVVVVLSLRANKYKKAVGAVIPGKLNMFFQQSSIVLFVTAHLVSDSLQGTAEVIAWISMLTSVPFAVLATRAYARLLK
jgi:cardiolipin synthase